MKSKSIDKKVLLTIIAAVLLVAVAAFAVWRYYVRVNQKIAIKNIADIEWYSEEETEFTISTAEELYDLATLSDFYSFEGQTIKLGADIVLNEGSAKNWSLFAPVNRWYPISGFAGTFDGQGHTISGLYGKGIETSMGLFAETKKDCVIEDFRLVNSYFDIQGGMGLGSIIGGYKNGGTLRRIYSDAILKCDGDHVGGLISVVYSPLQLEECWFDGQIISNGWENGGLVGSVKNGEVRMEHCLSSGTIKVTFKGDSNIYTGSRTGCMIGNTAYGIAITLDMEDCLITGDLAVADDKYTGSAVGLLEAKTATTITNTYAIPEIYKVDINMKGPTVDGCIMPMSKAKLTGFGGYQWTLLDFDQYWAVVENGTPVLKYFAEKVPDVSGVEKKIDASWYTEDGTEFVLDSWADVYGFDMLSIASRKTFQDQTIKLDTDFALNAGYVSEWTDNPPEFIWYPIKDFAGTFDGQRHTISGLYVSGDSALGFFSATTEKAVVKNFRLENSYFYTDMDGVSWKCIPVGSVVGSAKGRVENIYSSATIVNTGDERHGVGGIVGCVENGIPATISNCWFDGTIKAMRGAGGIVGALVSTSATVEHCLNSGTLEQARDVKKASRFGGICGYIIGYSQDTVLTINDSLNVGKVITFSPYQVGSVFGYMTSNEAKDARADVRGNSVYASKDSCKTAAGVSSSDYSIKPVVMSNANLTGYHGYKMTTLDFANAWAVVEDSTPILQRFASSIPSLKGVNRYDTSWYDAKATKLTIHNKNELYGMGVLALQSVTFKGQTVELAESISLNSGDLANGAVTAETDYWIPIVNFAGTFDGKGHTISGLYASDDSALGIFASTTETAVVKNFRLENSYFYTDKDGVSSNCIPVGSVVGSAKGRVENIYSNATIVNTGDERHGVGGIVGCVDGGITATISNCWFDGTIKAMRGAGGIIGALISTSATVEHCLNSGTLEQAKDVKKASRFGGICGYVIAYSRDTVLTINDSLNVGTVTAFSPYQMGSVFGYMTSNEAKNARADVRGRSVYTSKDSCKTAAGVSDSSYSLDIVVMSGENLTGYHGYKMTTLDFANAWAVVEDSTPILQRFASSIPSLKGVNRYDTSWYDAKATKLTIHNKNELYGMGVLALQGVTFKGQTVELAESISLNSGDLANGAVTAETDHWIPIVNFAGTFDGKGHTISGLYASGDSALGLFASTTETAVVKNFRLENSYFYTDKDGAESSCIPVGSVVGSAKGRIENIYSSATIVNTGDERHGVGGIVGCVENGIPATISNCWFDGTIKAMRGAGGIVGALVSTSATVEHCLNSGTLEQARDVKKASRFGGICGYINAYSRDTVLTISDSLNVGTVTTFSPYQVGSVFGYMTSNEAKKAYADVRGRSVYTSKDSCKTAAGVSDSSYSLDIVVMSGENLTGYHGYKATTLDFANSWAVVEDSTPILRAFASVIPDLTGYERPDFSWYDDESTEFTLTSKAELSGLAFLSTMGTSFDGKTIYLGADITVNSDTPKTKDDWDTYLAENADRLDSWSPIGTASTPFAGTFDGQGHTIRGVYQNSVSANSGLFGVTAATATVKDFRLENSYFTSTATYTGSIAGKGNGTFENIYSNAAVVASATCAGGMIGGCDGSAATSYTGLEFAGSVTASNGWRIGGIVGGVQPAAGSVAISNCINNGISVTNTATAKYIGGIVGGYTPTDATAVLTIQNSKNTATVSTPDSQTSVGGIMGGFTGTVAATLNIEGCWNDGAVSGGSRCAGIVGDIEHTAAAATANIHNCLNSGSITAAFASKNLAVGGLVGKVGGGNADTISGTSNLNIGNVVNVGAIHITAEAAANANFFARAAFVIGDYHTNGTVTPDGNWYVGPTSKGDNMASATRFVGGKWRTQRDSLNNNAYVKNGYESNAGRWNGYMPSKWLSGLDYTAAWALRKDTYPVPAALAETRLINPDTTWYTADPDATTFTVTTAEELAGLAFLTRQYGGGETFAGKTVQLGADITLNDGDSATWGETAPAYEWISIGTYYNFAGTFDGQGHTISGVYLAATTARQGLFAETAATAVLKDFRLRNSYFTTNTARLGSIAGTFAGRAERIYSDALVNATGGNCIGGLFGVVTNATVSECWYDGAVSAAGKSYVGGLIGSVQDADQPVTLEHSLFSGTVSGSNQVGGLIGISLASATGGVTIHDSASLGTVAGTAKSGMLVGENAVALTVTHSVAANEGTLKALIGANSGSSAITDTAKLTATTPSMLTGSSGSEKLSAQLDFTSYWVIREDAVPAPKQLVGAE